MPEKNQDTTPRKPRKAKTYPALDSVTSPIVPTPQAAYYLGRQSQTLRAWACYQRGALKPVNIAGRLSWSVAEIRALTQGGAA